MHDTYIRMGGEILQVERLTKPTSTKPIVTVRVIKDSRILQVPAKSILHD